MFVYASWCWYSAACISLISCIIMWHVCAAYLNGVFVLGCMYLLYFASCVCLFSCLYVARRIRRLFFLAFVRRVVMSAPEHRCRRFCLLCVVMCCCDTVVSACICYVVLTTLFALFTCLLPCSLFHSVLLCFAEQLCWCMCYCFCLCFLILGSFVNVYFSNKILIK